MLHKTKDSPILFALIFAAVLFAGCGGKKTQTDASQSAEPDKVLYERALDDIRRGRHTVGRLTLQTLINTYPDSEYLAKAKLSICDSFYKEGGSAGLTQAVAECKDFITFFPFMPEAVDAQMTVAMAHYRRMEKPDRDRTYARLAEEEFQQFLRNYPEHARAIEAEQRLREVQEVLAEGDYRIARYYYIKGSFKASGGRLLEMVDRYPLYSNADRALWMLGDIFERAEHGEIAARYYSRIVKDHPLSALIPEAKARLEKLGVPIPQPDPAALARVQKERETQREKAGLMRRTLGMFKSGPDVSVAAKSGKPQMDPPAEPGGEVLVPVGNTITAAPAGTAPAAVTGGTAGSPTAGGNAATNPTAANENSNPRPELPNSKESEEKKRKQEEEKKKKEQESSSKKKKKRLWPF